MRAASNGTKITNEHVLAGAKSQLIRLGQFDDLAKLPGSETVTKAGLRAVTFAPMAFINQQANIAEHLGNLVGSVGGDQPSS